MVGWPAYSLAESGLTRAARRGMIAALGPDEVASLCRSPRCDVVQHLQGLLSVFGIVTFSEGDMSSLITDLHQMHDERSQERCEEADASSDGEFRWDLRCIPAKHPVRYPSFLRRGRDVMQCICSVSTPLGTAHCILLQQDVVLLPSRILAHPSQARHATVSIFELGSSPVPRVTLRLNPKRFFVTGMQAGTSFSYKRPEIIDNARLRVAAFEEDDEETPQVGSVHLPIGSLVCLECCPAVLLRVEEEEEGPAKRYTLCALQGAHALQAPKPGRGAVHRVGNREAYTAAALNLDQFDDKYIQMSRAQRSALRALLKRGIDVRSGRPGEEKEKKEEQKEDEESTGEPAAASGLGGGGPLTHVVPLRDETSCTVHCAVGALAPEEARLGCGAGSKSTRSLCRRGPAAPHLRCAAAETPAAADHCGSDQPPGSQGVLFDLAWRFQGFLIEGKEALLYPAILQDMVESAHIDPARGSTLSQGDGLLDARLAIRAHSTRPSSMEADRLEWGTQGFSLKLQEASQGCSLPDYYEDGSLTLPPFSVSLLNREGRVDVMASGNIVATVQVDPPVYTLRHNSTDLIRGIGSFYHMTVTPKPEGPFRLLATVEVVFTRAVRYPLHRRHLLPQYQVRQRSPLASCPITLEKARATAEEAAELSLLQDIADRPVGLVPHPPVEAVEGFSIYHIASACRVGVAAGDGGGGGGSPARMLAAFKALDADRGSQGVVVGSGNFFGPSIEASVTEGCILPAVLNKLNLQGTVVGSHEMDYGEVRFAHLTESCGFPFVLSNIRKRRGAPLAEGGGCGGEIPGTVTHAVVVEPTLGVRVGLLGLVDEDWSISCSEAGTASQTEFAYLGKLQEARQIAQELRKTCAVVVALTNMQLKHDVALAEKGRGFIDLILGGREHDVSCTKVGGIPIVRSGHDFQAFHHIRLKMKAGRLDSVVCEPVHTEGYPEDAEMLAILSHAHGKLAAGLERSVMSIPSLMDCTQLVFGNSIPPASIMVTDAMMHYFAPAGCDVALLQGRCFRSDTMLHKGSVTVSDLFSIVPTEVPVVLLEMLGEDLLGLIEAGLGEYPGSSETFVHFSGLQVTAEPSQPEGKRVLEARLQRSGSPGGWRDVGCQEQLLVALPAFVAASETLRRKRRVVSEAHGVILPTVIQRYAASLGQSEGCAVPLYRPRDEDCRLFIVA